MCQACGNISSLEQNNEFGKRKQASEEGTKEVVT